MPYVGGDLSKLFARETTGPPTRRLLHGVADDAATFLTDAAAAHTPKRTGRLARSWTKVPPRIVGEDRVESGTENRSPLAHLVERGTGPHEIRPRDEEAIQTPEGPRASADHPGTEGEHMLAKALAELEAALPGIGERHTREWAAEVERRAKQHRGIT